MKSRDAKAQLEEQSAAAPADHSRKPSARRPPQPPGQCPYQQLVLFPMRQRPPSSTQTRTRSGRAQACSNSSRGGLINDGTGSQHSSIGNKRSYGEFRDGQD